ncbi:DUF1064 domain-containing protein [Gellertiella hungarica]|uniref:DUF1064 domain-containing protein n=1 Tax=Gellertiella hungarica TaxID=1572859 RepID=A0A7W6J8K9_9HYPH|nr:DUF1064 domain-containing protein [Gellertiella hungarica]MBB4066778.1 hypothetical protein [Gellertiella hungarica]
MTGGGRIQNKAGSGRLALGRLKTGEMNKTEAAYAAHLENEKLAGRVVWFEFDCFKFRLADNTFYTPDFAVMLSTGHLEMHEVKGFWQDDARVKIKVAADLFPLRFIAVRPLPKKDGGGWSIEAFE